MQSIGQFCAGNPAPAPVATPARAASEDMIPPPDRQPDTLGPLTPVEAVPETLNDSQDVAHAEPVGVVNDSQVPPTVPRACSLETLPATASQLATNQGKGLETPQQVRTGLNSPSLSTPPQGAQPSLPADPKPTIEPSQDLSLKRNAKDVAEPPGTVAESEPEADESISQVMAAPKPTARDANYWRPYFFDLLHMWFVIPYI